MNTNETNITYPFADEVYKITGAAMSVLNNLGHGFAEKIYEKGLIYELTSSGFKVDSQKPFDVIYKEQNLGTYIPDIIINEQIIVELKTINKITDHEIGQTMNYLKVTGLTMGVILNFKHTKLEWKRVILSK